MASTRNTSVKFKLKCRAKMLKGYLKVYSRTSDRDFCCFYPCELLLSVPARGKDKKEELHVGL